MYESLDKLVSVDVAGDMSQVSFPEADFSIVNLPSEEAEAKLLFNHLYNTPVNNHVALVVNRHKRKETRFQSLFNLQQINNFKYLDAVHIWYEKSSGGNSCGFSQVCEPGWLFYKGDELPDMKRTEWFSNSHNNATNLWAVSPNVGEIYEHTYYQYFNFETALLLYSLASPSATRKFIYGFDGDDENLWAFCKTHSIGVYLYERSDVEAKSLVEKYNKFSESFLSKKAE